jgi:hypothetical protein
MVLADSTLSTNSQTFFSRARPLRKVRSVSELGQMLLEEDRSTEIFYQAALSQLSTYITQAKFDTPEELNVFLARRKRLALQVLRIGVNLYALCDKLTYDEKKKRHLAQELYYCELMAGVGSPKWKHHFEFNSQIDNLNLRQLIRKTTAQTNWYRLYLIRLKRAFVSLMPLIKSILYQKVIQELELLNPFISYLAWLFYVPRLLANLTTLFSHIVPGSWMSEEELQVPWKARAWMCWSRLWFELLNDAVWCAVGLMCCFVLTGGSALALTVGLYFFDLILALINAYISIQHHQKLKAEVDLKIQDLLALQSELQTHQSLENQTILREELELLAEYKQHLNDWMLYEQLKLNLSVQVTTALSVAMTIGLLPTLFTLTAALSIFCPVVSALAVVLICSVQYYRSWAIEKYKPQQELVDLNHPTVDQEQITQNANNDAVKDANEQPYVAEHQVAPQKVSDPHQPKLHHSVSMPDMHQVNSEIEAKHTKRDQSPTSVTTLGLGLFDVGKSDGVSNNEANEGGYMDSAELWRSLSVSPI